MDWKEEDYQTADNFPDLYVFFSSKNHDRRGREEVLSPGMKRDQTVWDHEGERGPKVWYTLL
jgi:hypothetical protein